MQQQLCDKLMHSIHSEIEKSSTRESDHNIDQLRQILTELEAMSTTDNALISYPRIIIDSWDHNDNLGAELLELADLYEKKRPRSISELLLISSTTFNISRAV
ncbi:hypothetical protein [Butyrivibrio sp. VCD2006]|uniref:hypothetical protein n=1 Tax=Butyrivibrio sp. VCD2006 TaxID=1280664 RepID=UPI00047CEB32|nr:hypothetical protein [Butyrivibrio sp. VCD2006]